MPKYRVRRNLANNTEIQLRASDLEDCRELLQSLKRRWDDVSDVGTWDGHEPYQTKLTMKPLPRLVVTHGERVVDEYIVEKA